MEHERILVLDFGGQYNQLIARRVRDLKVYSDLKPCTMSITEIKAYNPIGIIFTGGPNSVYDETSPHVDKEIFELGIPVLGICYGCQLIAYTLGGEVTHAQTSEYGKREIVVKGKSKLFKDVPEKSISWMSHTDYVSRVPAGYSVVADTAARTCPVAAFENEENKNYGIQFHPEVVHCEYGNQILKNFLYEVCGASGDWTMSGFV
ncbi:MAG: glutamine-hydrolyzing GMP synthase, partial [Clostridia bacterium]|nr:glutamine-hydrolyzing GMP synthase [Clostridia bacterium]